MKLLQKIFSLALLLPVTVAFAGSPATDKTTTAKWQQYQIKFHYAGFTTDYTCDGARDKVKLLLGAIGARDDVKVENTCTGSFSEIQPFQDLKLAFALPVPAEPTDVSEATFPANWGKVHLTSNHPRDLDQGDCELVEQFAKQVLSKTNVREVVNDANCIPHQQTLNSPNLSATLLMQQKPQVLEPAKAASR